MTVPVKSWVGWVGAAAVLGGVGVWAAMGAGHRAAAPVVAEPVRGAPAIAAPVAPVAATVAGPEAPRFDVVRVSPEGRAVIAGRAEPGAEVVVRDGDAEVARARAGPDGAFVVLPETPFAPGGRELTLTSRNGAGVEARSDGSVLLVVPPPAYAGGAETPAVQAVLVPGAAAPRVLGAPGGEKVGGVSLDIVDYGDTGAIRFTGGAAAGGVLRVYVDNGAAGDVQADGRGRWTLTPERDVTPGMHTLRVDELDRSGRVIARVELPFERAAVAASALVLAKGRVVVQPGQNLWRLARAVYGQGVRYRVIYLANRDQIRDPRRIYPGQLFAVPSARGR